MKTVILAGGMGMRMKENTESIPKPLVPIGERPILWHVMKLYSHYGFHDFVICLGYKGERIKEYFTSYRYLTDFTLRLGSERKIVRHTHGNDEWSITFAETGEATETGGRIKKIEQYIAEDDFFCTYADGLSTVNLRSLMEFHKKQGKIGTLTALRPLSQFGMLDIGDDDLVRDFQEKPRMSQWVNGGFFVFNKGIFGYLRDGDILERDTIPRLIQDREIAAYRFNGFWKCMDTFKDAEQLKEMWKQNSAPWRLWN